MNKMKEDNKKMEDTLRNALAEQKKYIDDLLNQKAQLKDELLKKQQEMSNMQGKLQSAS